MLVISKYYTLTQVYFGKDTEKNIGRILREYGATNVLIHYGSERINQSSLLDVVIKSLDENKISATNIRYSGEASYSCEGFSYEKFNNEGYSNLFDKIVANNCLINEPYLSRI